MQQLTFFPEIVYQFWDDHPDVQASRQRRRDHCDRLGGLLRLKLADGGALVQPGSVLYLVSKKPVCVYRLSNHMLSWRQADLECFALRGDELEFEAALGFTNDPEGYIKGRSLIVVSSSECWSAVPTSAGRKAVAVEARSLEQRLWEWLVREMGEESGRQELRLLLAGGDRQSLNNLYWFCHKQTYEHAARQQETIDQDDFDDRFWRVLELLAGFQDGETLPPIVPRRRVVQPVHTMGDRPLSQIG